MGYLKRGKGLLKGAADAAFRAAQVVVRNQDKIAGATESVLAVTGSAVMGAGGALAGAGKKAARQMKGQAARSDHPLAKAVAFSVGVVGSGVEATGQALRGLGRATERSAPVIGATTGGIARGGASMASEVMDSVAITRADLDALRSELASVGEAARKDSERTLGRIEAARRQRRKAEMLDTLVVGGVSLATVLDEPDAVPARVEEAFELAYPGLATHESFATVVERMSTAELPGLVAGVKGKLFELELVDHLNNGGLPDGLEAQMAQSATQASWDLQIVDGSGQVVDVLQAKATESVHYVLEAIKRYPSIDVTTTEEVYAQLLALGMAEGVTNSGISESALETQVLQAADGQALGLDDLLPSTLGLAVIGLSVFMDKEITWTQRGEQFGERGAQAGLAGGAAKVALVVTQTWWIGLLAGVGSRVLASKGRMRREQYEALQDALQCLRERYPSPPNTTGLLPYCPGDGSTVA